MQDVCTIQFRHFTRLRKVLQLKLYMVRMAMTVNVSRITARQVQASPTPDRYTPGSSPVIKLRPEYQPEPAYQPPAPAPPPFVAPVVPTSSYGAPATYTPAAPAYVQPAPATYTPAAP